MLYTFDSAVLTDRVALPDGTEEEYSDEQLMEGIQKQNEDALAKLYRRHRDLLYSIVLRIVNDAHHAEDLVQEVFVEVWAQANRFSAEKGKALGWLITLARRRAIDRVRRHQAYHRAEERLRVETEKDTLHPKHFSVDA